jgi:hypothetical protein
MKELIRRFANSLGYEILNRAQYLSQEAFHSDHYLRHNARRLEHLATFGIPVTGKTVLELGAGIGDHSSYYLDRGCKLTMTEARAENLQVLRKRYPQEKVISLNMEDPKPVNVSRFDVVHCYGLLYHLQDAAAALSFIGANCDGSLFLETCVSFGSGKSMNPVDEDRQDFTQSISGRGCRPTRPWLFSELQKHFPHVYCPKTQPNHEEFPLDWNGEKPPSLFGNVRSVFVASRSPIASDILSPTLLDIQTRSA